MNSNELFDKAVAALQRATGCDEYQARQVVLVISAYHARITEEVLNQRGPGWDRVQEIECS